MLNEELKYKNSKFSIEIHSKKNEKVTVLKYFFERTCLQESEFNLKRDDDNSYEKLINVARQKLFKKK